MYIYIYVLKGHVYFSIRVFKTMHRDWSAIGSRLRQTCLVEESTIVRGEINIIWHDTSNYVAFQPYTVFGSAYSLKMWFPAVFSPQIHTFASHVFHIFETHVFHFFKNCIFETHFCSHFFTCFTHFWLIFGLVVGNGHHKLRHCVQ